MLTAVLIVFLSICSVQAACPHESYDRKWSEGALWSSGQKPVAGADVVISDKVLFDESTPRLNTITIEPTGHLVWSPVETHMTVSGIIVKGRLDIGSVECMFDAKAHITLTGIRGTAPSLSSGGDQKGIIVESGGTLEIHGKQKQSWTKLTTTVNKLSSASVILDHERDLDPQESIYPGLHVYVIDPSTAAVVDFSSFRTSATNTNGITAVPAAFKSLLDGVSAGQVVMIAAHRNIFSSVLEKDSIYEAVETLAFGSINSQSQLRTATADSNDAYVLLAIKGDTSQSQELLVPTAVGTGQTAEVSSTDWLNGYKYRVKSYMDNEVNGKGRAEFYVITVNGAYPVLNLLDDVTSWNAGDQVFLASTDYDWEQAEEATVVECLSCTATQVQIDLEVAYTHWGEITEGVDMRGEVALLSRYIFIEGEMEDSCPASNGNCEEYPFDTFGGQVKVLGVGFKDVHIEGAEFYHMGQQTAKGHYPLHFHMCEEVDDAVEYPDPPYLRDNSIHDTFARCITVHGTQGVTVQDNVGYKSIGHCFFLEDGGERLTVLDGNLGASVYPGSLIPSDGEQDCSVFWITNPDTRMRNNVAAGSVANGIWYVYPEEPMGPSTEKGWFQPNEARRTKIVEFTNNVAHSCVKTGIRVDNELDSAGNLLQFNRYEARVDPLEESSALVEVSFDRPTAYKCGSTNAWIRGVWMTMQEASMSDSLRGISLVGDMNNQNALYDSVILGDSPNIGEPTVHNGVAYNRSIPIPNIPDFPVIGYIQYGTPVSVYNTWFNYFETTSVRQAGAVGFNNMNPHRTAPNSRLWNLGFGFDDGVSAGNRVFDGDDTDAHFTYTDDDKTETFRDIDGTTTGTAGSQIVKQQPFHVTANCFIRANWKLAVCPYRYGKLKIVATASGHPNTALPFMIRDDIPAVKEEREDQDPDFQVILGGDYSYTLHWNEQIPATFTVSGWAVEKELAVSLENSEICEVAQDMSLDYPVRIGLCLPLDAQFELKRCNPIITHWGDWTAATDVAQVDSDLTGKTYYWDSQTGMLFVKMLHEDTLNSSSMEWCPGGDCDDIKVNLTTGTLTDSDCSTRAYGPYVRTVQDSAAQLTAPAIIPMTSSTPPQNYGAGETRPFLTRTAVDGAFGDWSAWSVCTLTCGGGTQYRTRACDNPIPSHGGALCQGDLVEQQSCNIQAC